jgi:hypothetical protein
MEKLLTTGKAARTLGISVCSLRRYRDIVGGFLKKDEHWFSGAYENSPMRWDIQKCHETISNRNKITNSTSYAS